MKGCYSDISKSRKLPNCKARGEKGKGCRPDPPSAVLLGLWEHRCCTATVGTTAAAASQEARGPCDGSGLWKPQSHFGWKMLLLLELLIVFWRCCYDCDTITAICVACHRCCPSQSRRRKVRALMRFLLCNLLPGPPVPGPNQIQQMRESGRCSFQASGPWDAKKEVKANMKLEANSQITRTIV